jgi:hypothetical protein
LRMGQKKKQTKQDISYELARMMVPTDFLEYFEVYEIRELSNEWQVVLHEKEDLLPDKLKSKADVVLDGFCNPMTLLSHCFSIKPIYLVMKRRRWKQAGTDMHFSNEYTLTKDTAKLTPDMAGFLKI